MYVDYRLNTACKRICKELSQLLALKDGETNLQIYMGLHHGLTEIMQGLVRLFPNKRKIYYLEGFDPSYESIVTEFAKEGFQIQGIKRAEFEKMSWATTVERDDLLVLYAKDDPLLGVTVNDSAMDAALKEKRIFRVCVHHGVHFSRPIKSAVSRFQIDLYSLGPQRSVALLGEKAKMNAPVSENMHWTDAMASEFRKDLSSLGQAQESKEKILKFETACPSGSTPALASFGENRNFDRAVICWEDMDGYAYIDELARLLKTSLKGPGMENRLETASLSRWGGVRSMEWLSNYGLSLKQVRGLVLISQELITDSFLPLMQQARENVLQMQSGLSVEV